MTTPSQARNAIKRCLTAVLDPRPTKGDIRQLWDYFGEECAYCGTKAKKGEADKDHLIAHSEGGMNGLSNLVVACKVCNGNEKLETDWIAFLRQKCEGDAVLFGQRMEKILGWVEMNGGQRTMSETHRELKESAFIEIDAVLKECVQKLREIRDA